jgi:DNA-binding NarL/FixJ family response regulator
MPQTTMPELDTALSRWLRNGRTFSVGLWRNTAYNVGRCSAPRYDATFDVLTRREYAIAALAANGLSNKEIARQLDLTESTVIIKAHLHHVYQKTRVSNRTALTALINGYVLR